MLRLGSTGDWHVTSGRRFADTCKAIDFVVDDGRERGVNLWLAGGDWSGIHDCPHIADVRERDYLDRTFQRMAEQAPTIVLLGNHDDPTDLLGYGRLSGPHPIHVVTTPRVLELEHAVVFCLPYPHRRLLIDVRNNDASIKDQNLEAADVVRKLLADWAALKFDPDKPRVLFAHLNVRGAMTAGDEVLAAKEVELTPEDLDAFPADYVALGHIHLHQKMSKRAWYAGSPSAQTFGEPDPKGYVVVDVVRGKDPVITRVLTPARQLETINMRWVKVKGTWQWMAPPVGDFTGKEIKVRVEIPEDAMGSCPVDELKAELLAMGAHDVTADSRIVPTERVRSESIGTAQTMPQKLEAWWEAQGDRAPKPAARESLFAKLADAEAAIAAGWKEPS